MSAEELSEKLIGMFEKGNGSQEAIDNAFHIGKRLAKESGIGIGTFYGLWNDAVNTYISRHSG